MKHLAIIMDGNRRWAKAQGLQGWFGHSKGAESIKRVTQFCLEQNISYLSLYTFSTENFKRPEHEKEYLFNLLKDQVPQQIEECLKRDIRMRFIGDRSLFPDSLIPIIDEAESETKQCTKLHLNFLFCYGSRQEIISGVKILFEKIKKGIIKEPDISEHMLSECFWTAGIPEPDLIIRTGGAKRISNFLLYQAAYSEFYFLDCLWPDITKEHLMQACSSFEQCQRNFGT